MEFFAYYLIKKHLHKILLVFLLKNMERIIEILHFQRVELIHLKLYKVKQTKELMEKV